MAELGNPLEIPKFVGERKKALSGNLKLTYFLGLAKLGYVLFCK